VIVGDGGTTCNLKFLDLGLFLVFGFGFSASGFSFCLKGILIFDIFY
jgi:hypothetical protein